MTFTLQHSATGRTPTPAEFRRLAPAARLELLRTVSGRRKLNLILDVDRPDALVAALPAQELYLLIRELGPADSNELLALMNAEQWTACLDLDVWSGDAPDPAAVQRWFELLAETGEERSLQILHELDFELLVSLVATQIRVLRSPGDIEDEDVRFEVMQRHGGYEIEYLDPEHAKIVATLLDILFRLDNDLFQRLLEAVRWESGAELGEEVYRLRNGRLHDLGLPDPESARSIYYPLDPSRFALDAANRRPPVDYDDTPAVALVLLESARPAGLLADLLAAGVSAETAANLVFLVNKALIAGNADAGDPAALRSAAEEVYATVNLALETLCDDVDGAARLLSERYPEDLFRLGIGLLRPLQQQAARLAAAPAAAFFDGPWRTVLQALNRPLPRFSAAIADPEENRERFFAGRADLEAARAWLTGCEALVAFVEDAGAGLVTVATQLDLIGCEPKEVADLTLSDLFLTALANRVLERGFLLQPIPAADLATLHRRVSREERLDPQLRSATLSDLTPELAPFATWALDLFEAGFCATPEKNLDPRYCEGLIVRL